VNGLVRVLAEEHTAALDPEGQRLFGLVRQSATGMGQLIDDLLAFSRLGRREIQARDIDMRQLANAVGRELLQLEADRSVQLEVGPLPGARGDPALVRQIFVNLISNALKFSRSRTDAAVRIGSETHDGATAYFVRDNGVGFDMKYVTKLFNVFQRLHTVREFEGTGVGLAIVRRIVERHGGRVWAEARAGEGATFYFTLAPQSRESGT
jgi:light-regulated signal transduction histidine kinase (bacteriophytochrome)